MDLLHICVMIRVRLDHYSNIINIMSTFQSQLVMIQTAHTASLPRLNHPLKFSSSLRSGSASNYTSPWLMNEHETEIIIQAIAFLSVFKGLWWLNCVLSCWNGSVLACHSNFYNHCWRKPSPPRPLLYIHRHKHNFASNLCWRNALTSCKNLRNSSKMCNRPHIISTSLSEMPVHKEINFTVTCEVCS